MPDERIAVLETRVDSMEGRMEGIEDTVFSMGDKINDIHTVVVANKTNMSWVKKLTIIILGLCLTGAGFFGWNNLRQEASAKQPVHHGSKEIKATKR